MKEADYLAQFGYDMSYLLDAPREEGTTCWVVRHWVDAEERVSVHVGHVPTMCEVSGKNKAEAITDYMRAIYGKDGIDWWYIGRRNKEVYEILWEDAEFPTRIESEES